MTEKNIYVAVLISLTRIHSQPQNLGLSLVVVVIVCVCVCDDKNEMPSISP